ncbi:MAG: hypothetical protein QOJ23_5544, partial [Actinomycetota bacterium]|nr:hypothetical protein [Actinomycetota bacterium]
PAEASREPHPTTTTTEPSYVPPPTYGQNPHPELPPEPNPYVGSPVVAPTIVPVDLPVVGTNPGAVLAGGGTPLDEAPTAVLGTSDTRPEVKAPAKGGGSLGGVLSRTGAETMPLVRAGLAALALGAGFIMLARRRRADAASA